MLNQISSRALSDLDDEARLREIGALIDHTKSANGSATVYLLSRITQFEQRYELSSAELHEALRSGTQRETADIAEWLFLLETLKRHDG